LRSQKPEWKLTHGFQLAEAQRKRIIFQMKVQEIRDFAERKPFRAFGVRLNNGAEYVFREPRNLGAPEDYRLLIYFGKTEAVRIDPDSITEIFEN
jgi:hypothetical protein